MRAFASTLLLLALPATAAAAPAMPAVPTPALIEKLGRGDRLFVAGDYRNALFAYQDAVYLQPAYAPARVKLGRAYLALRYPERALSQAEAALASDPDNADARKLRDDARNAASRAAGAPAPAAVAGPGVRIYRLTPEPPGLAPAPVAATTTAVAGLAATDPAAAQHYRAGLLELERGEWSRAASELSTAIAADPNLAAAYTARGRAYFELGRYQDAIDDHREAFGRAPSLAAPLYELGECYRLIGEGRRAAEWYSAYAASTAPDARADLRAVATKRAQDLAR